MADGQVLQLKVRSQDGNELTFKARWVGWSAALARWQQRCKQAQRSKFASGASRCRARLVDL